MEDGGQAKAASGPGRTGLLVHGAGAQGIGLTKRRRMLRQLLR